MQTIRQLRKRQNTRTRRRSGGSTTKKASKGTVKKVSLTQWAKNNPVKVLAALLAAGGLGLGVHKHQTGAINKAKMNNKSNENESDDPRLWLLLLLMFIRRKTMFISR